MHRAGAAERDERVAAWIDPALDRHHAQCPEHLLVRDPDDAGGRLGGVHVQLPAQALECAAGRVDVEPHAARERGVGVEIAERHVRVGDGRILSAGAVAGWTWLRARGLRADAEGASGVGPGDAPASGADGVHVDHRQLEHSSADRSLGCLPHLAAVDHGDVARSPTHVEGQDVLRICERTEVCGADHATGGPR
jgi:hypothetical protein